MRFDLPADARVEGRAHRTRRRVQARFHLFECRGVMPIAAIMPTAGVFQKEERTS